MGRFANEIIACSVFKAKIQRLFLLQRWPETVDYESRLIFVGKSIQVGEWRCYPDSCLWHEENIAGNKPMIVFPRSAVQIQHAGRDRFITSPNHVVYYNKDQAYRRGLASRRGDICEYVYVEPQVLSEVQRSLGFRQQEDINAPFEDSHGLCHRRAFVLQRLICKLIVQQRPEPLLVEESFLELLPTLLLEIKNTTTRAKSTLHPKTNRTRLSQVEATKKFLNDQLAKEITLDQVAEACDASPFHISRVFKQFVGTSIFQYLIALRLRTAFEQIVDSDRSLTTIALDTGFSSQSHLTNLFKREFGMPPGSVRKQKPLELIRRVRSDPVAR